MSTHTQMRPTLADRGITVLSVPAARAELAELGVTDAQMARVTGMGGRGNDNCHPDDSILNKYRAGALTCYGVMSVLYGPDSRQHHAGTAVGLVGRRVNYLAGTSVDALVTALAEYDAKSATDPEMASILEPVSTDIRAHLAYLEAQS